MSALAFARLVLGVCALVFLGGGALFTAQPGVVAAVGIELGGVDARNDFRAVYGGMELGLGVFLGLCLRGEARLHFGLVLAGLVFAAMVATRLYSVAADGAPSGFVWGLTAAEGAGGALCALALVALVRSERAASG